MHHKTDVVIIGAGPVGIFCAFELGMLGMKSIICDSLPHAGGQCSALYPEKPIYDIPAFPSIQAEDFIHNLIEQASRFSPIYQLGSQIVAVEKKDNGFIVTNSSGVEIECRAIFIAAGAGAFGPNRPPLEDIEKYENNSVFYSVANKKIFANKRVVIAGGGDSAVDWANSLSTIASKIFLVHRRDKFRAFEASLNELNANIEAGKIELITPYQLHALHGSDSLQAVEVIDLNGAIKTIEADYLLPFFGLKMELGPIAQWNLDLEKGCIKVNPMNMQTNVEGIFAVGDIATYPGKLKLILCGFSEAAMAAHGVYNYLNPDKTLHFEYSTTKCQDIK